MKNYVMINNYGRLGTMGISINAIASIATKAVNSFRGVSIKSKKALFSVDKGVKITLGKDGRAIVSIDVILPSDSPVKTTCLNIQKEVASAISLMCDTVPYDVKIKVVKVA